MKLSANSGKGGDWEPMPAGSYRSVITGFIHIGTQDGGQFGPKNQCIVVFQPFDEDNDTPLTQADGQPWTISKFYTLSFNEKASLRLDVETMAGRSFKDGEEFEVGQLLGMQARIRIEHVVGKSKDGKDVTRAKITKVESVSKRDRISADATIDLASTFFEISGVSCPIPDAVGEWAKTKIMASPEWAGSTVRSAPTATAPPFNELIDDIAGNIQAAR
jgi:hypothetical protein